MLGELFDDLRNNINELRYGAPVRTITVAKPYCSPARHIITKALEPYGVKVHSISEHTNYISLLDFARRMKIEMRTHENLQYGMAAPGFLPIAIIAKITVNESAAAWAEYLLLRTGLLYVPGQYVNKRNQQWAERHGGRMPPAWKDGKAPWIETTCQSRLDAWQAVKNAQQSPKKEKK